MERKLVSIQTISDLSPIPNSDNIEAARVMGWTVVVKKGEFSAGDPCVFFEIDSVLPDGPAWSEFMRPRGFRVKTVRLRGVLSQGLALPLSILGSDVSLDGDLSMCLGVTKHETPLPVGMDCAGSFPGRVPKTDEIRLQSCLGVLDELGDVPCVVTTKLDGMSATYLRDEDGELIVCSRNWALARNATPHWQLADQLKLAEVLPLGYALQGEVCGPGIQRNRLGLQELALFAFDVYDTRRACYLDPAEMWSFCLERGISTVPVEAPDGSDPGRRSMDEWIARAKGFYSSSSRMSSFNRKEGIVVRPIQEMRSDTLGGRLSFKVINNDYLLKDDE